MIGCKSIERVALFLGALFFAAALLKADVIDPGGRRNGPRVRPPLPAEQPPAVEEQPGPVNPYLHRPGEEPEPPVDDEDSSGPEEQGDVHALVSFLNGSVAIGIGIFLISMAIRRRRACQRQDGACKEFSCGKAFACVLFGIAGIVVGLAGWSLAIVYLQGVM